MTLLVHVVVYVVVATLLLSLLGLLVTVALSWGEDESSTALVRETEDSELMVVPFDNISLSHIPYGDIGSDAMSGQIYIDDDLFTSRV